MANRRTLKHNINRICEELFAECIAVSLYSADADRENVEALLYSIVKMGGDYICRVGNEGQGLFQEPHRAVQLQRQRDCRPDQQSPLTSSTSDRLLTEHRRNGPTG
jgi:hypothetical protein